MAKIVSPVWSSARGSICGTTYLTTPAGQIIARQRTRPSNAPSPYRSITKGALMYAIGKWQGLTLATQTAWNLWALSNPPGDGRHQFIAAQALQNIGDQFLPPGWPPLMTVDTSVPTFHAHPSVSVIAKTYTTPASTGCKFRLTNTGIMAVCYICEISPPLNKARNYWKGPWNPATWDSFTIAAGAPCDQLYSTLTAGAKYFFRVRAFSFDTAPGMTGRVSSPEMITSAIAVTVP